MATDTGGLTPHEVFGNYDYAWAQKEKSEPSHPNLRALGRFARLVVSNEKAEKLQQGYDGKIGTLKERVTGLNHKRRLEKGLRKAHGSIDFLTDEIPRSTVPIKEPQPVLASPGLYRSNLAGEQPEPELTDEETDELMQGAVERARQKLGELPVMQMNLAQSNPNMPLQGAELPTRRSGVHARAFQYESLNPVAPLPTPPPTDAALLARLQQAFGDTKDVSSTSSKGGPHLHHNRLPGKQPVQKTDSTNA